VKATRNEAARRVRLILGAAAEVSDVVFIMGTSSCDQYGRTWQHVSAVGEGTLVEDREYYLA
jgi:hypothetical protein